MSSEPSVKARVDNLWSKVQRNSENPTLKKQILEECDDLKNNAEIQQDVFLSQKIKLIEHKAGRLCDLKEVISALEEHGKKDKNSTKDCFICIAEAYVHEAEPEKAIPNLEYALGIQEDPEVLNLLSLCYRRIKEHDYNKSIELAKQSLKLDMNNGKSWANLAGAHLAQGSFKSLHDAQKAYKMAIMKGEKDNADVVLNLGVVSELLLDLNLALEQYKKALDLTLEWEEAKSSYERLHNNLVRIAQRCEAVNGIRRRKKDELLGNVTAKNEYLAVESPNDRGEPAQVLICLTIDGSVVTLGIPQTMRPYIRLEKTILRLKKEDFTDLMVEGQAIKYMIIESMSDIQMMNSASPADIPAVSVTSSVQ